MKATLENAPSRTGNPSGGGRGNNPPRRSPLTGTGWLGQTGNWRHGDRNNALPLE